MGKARANHFRPEAQWAEVRSGHLGRLLARAWVAEGHRITVLGRRAPARPVPGTSFQPWDGRTLGRACAAAQTPPRVWLQSSTGTLYAHRRDAPNDETSGRIGGAEPDAPPYWRWSIDIARAWEAELDSAPTPRTRKVALRTAMVMSLEPGTVFDILLRLARLGLGGALAGGAQCVSWIHERDFVRALGFLLEREDLAGPINVCAPEPLPQREFARVLRRAAGVPLGLPAAEWMLELGALFLRTDTELLLKSRRVVPGRLLEAGFRFEHPEWSAAARELVARRRARRIAPRVPEHAS